MSETVVESRPRRKSLAEQLDRLDDILDTLADGLPQAIGVAARDGVRPVVKEVLVEVLTDPDLRRLICPPPPLPSHPHRPRATSSTPVLWVRAVAVFAAVWSAVGRRVASAAGGVTDRYRAARVVISAVARQAGTPLPVRRVAVVAGVAGLAGLGVCLLVSPALAATLAGLGVAGVAVVAQLAIWLTGCSHDVTPTGDGESVAG